MSRRWSKAAWRGDRILPGGQEPRRFRQPQRQRQHQHQREHPAQDEDHRPVEMREQQCDDLAADEAAYGRAGERRHDHRRAQAVRCVVAGQRGRPGKPAADAEPGEEAPETSACRASRPQH